jgi:hypothetical protein
MTTSYQQCSPARFQETVASKISPPDDSKQAAGLVGDDTATNTGGAGGTGGSESPDGGRGGTTGEIPVEEPAPLNECVSLRHATPEQMAQATSQSKVTVCHKATHAHDRYVTIRISTAALAPHLREHYDYLGACRAPTDPPCLPIVPPTHERCGNHTDRD